ncbi:hypothetical protein BpHYR1_032611 [Brachionus plicatilis]|uniref:Uncharacterized protein n=1 Tax=Brachionus plicatilis TaxID=10195 RepID=A0A3M7QYQ3_BRAPC|nr:hypothetical protein BpHYR1_032611 [Brachionus plicatilis]
MRQGKYQLRNDIKWASDQIIYQISPTTVNESTMVLIVKSARAKLNTSIEILTAKKKELRYQ